MPKTTSAYLKWLAVVLVFALVSPASAKSKPFSAKVVSIKDGDTLEVLKDDIAIRVRIAGIDCPELKGQPFGAAAKRLTSSLAFDKTVRVEPSDTDRYGRTIADVFLPDGRNLGHVLVGNGLAWWYRKYAPKNSELERLEGEAKKLKLGLWAEDSPIPPWDWRNSERKGKSRETSNDSSTPTEKE